MDRHELCKILCDKSIPTWVNRVAAACAKLPYLIKMLSQEYLTPVALNEIATKPHHTIQQVKKHMCYHITEVCFINTLLSYHLIQVNQVLQYTGFGISNKWASLPFWC